MRLFVPWKACRFGGAVSMGVVIAGSASPDPEALIVLAVSVFVILTGGVLIAQALARFPRWASHRRGVTR